MAFRSALLHFLRRRVYLRALEKAALYRRLRSRDEIEAFQLDRFNRTWSRSVSDVPFYYKWKKEHSLPDSISSLDELKQWPVLTKATINDNKAAFNWLGVKPQSYGKTGGSTGNPLHFGQFASEGINGAANMWIGRMAYGYRPTMKCFLLWGHEHLMGEGIQRNLNVLLRYLKDWIMGFYRVSAYDYELSKLRTDCEKMLRFRPKAIYCYSSSILAFIRANINRKFDVRKLEIQVVICTAGPLSISERLEISNFFGTPVCMEYGSAETAVMAYTDPTTGNYQTFWDDYIIEAQGSGEENPRVLVTSLMDKYLPLIRYDIGDLLERSDDFSSRPLRFASVIGRPSQAIRFADGTAFFMATIFDSVKQCPKVIASQVEVYEKRLEIRVVVSEILTSKDVNLIKNKCRLLVPSLNEVELVVKPVPDVEKTVAGKVKLVIDKR